MTVVSIHQGHFLPWLGYWNKVLCSDVFVWLDTVQFRKNYFQNRVHIKDSHGERVWLTAPVTCNHGDPLLSVQIPESNWKKKVLGTLRQSYGRAPFFGDYFPGIEAVIESSGTGLDDLNFSMFRHILTLIQGDSVQVVKGSMLAVSDEPTERLIDYCKHYHATVYIAGKGGANYMRLELFEHAGIQVVWQRYHENQPEYEQINGPFLAGLSVVDALFNVGAEKTRELITNAWKP